MLATQYKIILPSDYDMKVIKDRVKNNGYKTDGFEDLRFKFYLITEKGKNTSLENSYCPLYIWKDSNGLNKFLFNGFYDNIITSFGWQRVNVGIPIIDTTTSKIKDSNFVFEIIREIKPQEKLNNFKDTIEKDITRIDEKECIVIYNPEKWRYHAFYFTSNLSNIKSEEGTIYDILHISKETI